MDPWQVRMLHAAGALNSEYLCNWDAGVAAALADWLTDQSRRETVDPKAEATARALLKSFGMDVAEDGEVCRCCAVDGFVGPRAVECLDCEHYIESHQSERDLAAAHRA